MRRLHGARASRPNEGDYRWYRRKLREALRRMDRETRTRVVAVWNLTDVGNAVGDPELWAAAQNVLAPKAGPVLAELLDKWQKEFSALAGDVAGEFAARAAGHGRRGCQQAINEALKTHGFTVRATMTPRVREMVQALTTENAALIKTIPGRYFAGVQKAVQESVEKGRDIGGLKAALAERYEISDRRAEIIARDQNNKATERLARAQYNDLGITEGVWVHFGGQYQSRPTHEDMHGRRYVLAEGIYDPAEGRNVQPGELVLCACGCSPVVEGLR